MKKIINPVQKHGDFLADPVLCSTYMVQKAIEARLENRMRLSLNSAGVLQFLLSPQNVGGGMFDAAAIEAKINNPEGKKVLVRRKFRPVKTTKAITGGARNYCAPVEAAANPYKEDVIELGYDYTETLMSFNESELRLSGPGETINQAVAEEFVRALIAHENTFAAVVSKRLLAGDIVGTFKGGDAIRDLPLYLANGQAINPAGMVYLNQWLSEVGINEMPALIGGSLVQAYSQVQRVASPNLGGFDPSKAEGITTITDYSVPNVLGDADHALLVAPGAVQLFTYNLHQGEFVANENDPNTRRYTLTSPFTGIKWDAYWQRVRDCNTGDWQWVITLSLVWDLVGLPECWSDDACMDGVSDVFVVNIVCSDDGVCDITRGESCIDAANLPLAPDTIAFPASSVLCVQSCKLLLNTQKILNARQHSISTASTGAAIGLVFGGSTLNFTDPITLGAAPGSAALNAAVIAAIGTGGVVVSGAWTGSATTLAIMTDGLIAEVELIISGAANIEFTTVQYDAVCRVVSTPRPSTGATDVSLRFVQGAEDETGAPTAAITFTDTVGYFADFFVIGAGALALGDPITATYTDSAACTDVETLNLCTA